MESGAIIHIDYNLYNADTDYLIETTKEEVAKEAERHDPSKTYTPLVTVIGDGRLIAGFEEHLAEADVETDYVLVIPAEKAYGEKDPDSIEIMSQPQLLRNVRDADSLAIGGPVEIGGRNGVLTSLRAGRARVDFNHPLAGASLRYEYRIVKVIEDRAEKVQTLLETNTGRDGFEVEFEGDDVTITLPEFVGHNVLMDFLVNISTRHHNTFFFSQKLSKFVANGKRIGKYIMTVKFGYIFFLFREMLGDILL